MVNNILMPKHSTRVVNIKDKRAKVTYFFTSPHRLRTHLTSNDLVSVRISWRRFGVVVVGSSRSLALQGKLGLRRYSLYV